MEKLPLVATISKKNEKKWFSLARNLVYVSWNKVLHTTCFYKT